MPAILADWPTTATYSLNSGSRDSLLEAILECPDVISRRGNFIVGILGQVNVNEDPLIFVVQHKGVGLDVTMSHIWPHCEYDSNATDRSWQTKVQGWLSLGYQSRMLARIEA